jgi:glycine oxidase
VTKRVAVIGSGIVGKSIALELRRGNCDVTIFEKSVQGAGESSSYYAGGLVTPGSETDFLPENVLRIAGLALAKHAEFRERYCLNDAGAQNGSLVVAHSRDQALWQDQVVRLGRLEGAVHYTILGKEELAQLEPTLDRFPRALFFPDESHLDCREWLAALDGRLLESGVETRYGQMVTDCAAVLENEFDLAIDCRGMGAARDIPALRGVLGESIVVETKEVHLVRPTRILHPRYPLYIVPRAHNRFYVGATVLESERETGIAVRSALELLSALISVQPMFGEAHVVETIRAQRPSFPNHAPKILWSQGILRVNGMFRYGFLLAPFLADLVRDFVTHERVPDQGASFFERG